MSAILIGMELTEMLIGMELIGMSAILIGMELIRKELTEMSAILI